MTYTHTDDETGRVLAWSFPARSDGVAKVMAATEGDEDGRSEWVWIRLANGDLFLGVAPRGDTYEDLEAETQLPRDASEPAPAVRHERRQGIDYLRDQRGVSVSFFRMPENDQLYVGVNTEDAEYDNDKDGEPILQVMLNDASLYDHERPKREAAHPVGPLLLRCVFTPQRDTDPGRGFTIVEPIDPAMLGRAWHEFTWIAEYDEPPSEQRSEATDALRDHPAVPQWIKEWDGPFEIDFQVRYTVVGTYDGETGKAARYAEAFWADSPEHAEEQARESARSLDETLTVSAVLYGDAMVAA